ncbi:hypothetical protein A8B78_12980 [Jannaschia sp. EhC01]|nr:hypothetical protein A8B78_12980 [Jannaschia sp. EhC01]
MRDAKTRDLATVHIAADANLRLEASIGFKSFKRFHIDQSRALKAKLAEEPMQRRRIDSAAYVSEAAVETIQYW